jgi:hypothetical protein
MALLTGLRRFSFEQMALWALELKWHRSDGLIGAIE